MSYWHEFPDFGTLDVDIPDGYADSSWHNDTMPSWSNEDDTLRIWVDYADASLSEWGEGRVARFAIHQYDEYGAFVQPLITSDNWQEVYDLAVSIRSER